MKVPVDRKVDRISFLDFRNSSVLLRGEQPPILVDAVDRRVFIPRGLAVATPFSFRDRVESSDKTERVVAGRQVLIGWDWRRGSSPSHGSNVSVFPGVEALNEDRRHAGRWDREQLIGGKAIEPRK